MPFRQRRMTVERFLSIERGNVWVHYINSNLNHLTNVEEEE